MRSTCFSDMLRLLLKADLGKTQRQLAGELCISESYLSRLLSGQRQPRLNLYLAIEGMIGDLESRTD